MTNADPLLTRLALGRSDDGSQFGMFLQIFADGTVIDSEGVHHLRQADLKPILDLLQSGDLTRTRGHCGAPATDFIDYVNIVVYERRLGRLWAHTLSYSGNPQGCDHAVRHLHTTLETLQTKLSRNTAGTPAPVARRAARARRPGINPRARASAGAPGRESGSARPRRGDTAYSSGFVEVGECLAGCISMNSPGGLSRGSLRSTRRELIAVCCMPSNDMNHHDSAVVANSAGLVRCARALSRSYASPTVSRLAF